MASWETLTFVILWKTGKTKEIVFFFRDVVNICLLPMRPMWKRAGCHFVSTQIEVGLYELECLCSSTQRTAVLCLVSALWGSVCTIKCQVCNSNCRPGAKPCDHPLKHTQPHRLCLSHTPGNSVYEAQFILLWGQLAQPWDPHHNRLGSYLSKWQHFQAGSWMSPELCPPLSHHPLLHHHPVL